MQSCSLSVEVWAAVWPSTRYLPGRNARTRRPVGMSVWEFPALGGERSLDTVGMSFNEPLEQLELIMASFLPSLFVT